MVLSARGVLDLGLPQDQSALHVVQALKAIDADARPLELSMFRIEADAVMLEQALYKVPKKLGWFNQGEQSLLLADNFEEPKTAEGDADHSKENDFKAIN